MYPRAEGKVADTRQGGNVCFPCTMSRNSACGARTGGCKLTSTNGFRKQYSEACARSSTLSSPRHSSAAINLQAREVLVQSSMRERQNIRIAKGRPSTSHGARARSNGSQVTSSSLMRSTQTRSQLHALKYLPARSVVSSCALSPSCCRLPAWLVVLGFGELFASFWLPP